MTTSKNLFFQETKSRSLVKTLVHRVLSISGTVILIWLITKNLKETASIAIAIQIFLITLYYFHERMWNKISWGREIKK